MNPDPKFPNRPQTPDFHKLSGVVRALDALVDEGGGLSFQRICSRIIDPHSLAYMAEGRAKLAVRDRGSEEAKESLIAAAYMDGFLAGAEYATRCGKSAEQIMVEIVLPPEEK